MATSHERTGFPQDRRSSTAYKGPYGRRWSDTRSLDELRQSGLLPEPVGRPACCEGNGTSRALGKGTRRIGHVEVCVATLSEALSRIGAAVADRRAGVWGFCNAHTVNMARSLPRFRSALTQVTLFNDGVGLDLASRLLYRERFPENLNGTDFTPALLRSLPESTPVFLLGSAPGVAERAGEVIMAQYPHIEIAGVQHGFFAMQEEETIVARITASGARLVLVAMGHPRQELWSVWASTQLAMPLLCVGAFLDFTAGKVSRAPVYVRSLHLEWMYRLVCEPRRLARRYLLGNLLFLACVVRQRFAHDPARHRVAPEPYQGTM